MEFMKLDVDLPDEVKAMHDLARRFGVEVMRPAGIELDKLHDPSEVIAEGSVLWDVIKKHRELGFHKLMIPKAFSGMMGEVPPMAETLISEQLGYADAGLAISLTVSSMPFAMAVLSPEAEIRKWAQEYAEDTEGNMIGCWGITEPDHGSDWVIGSTPGGADPRLAPSLRAQKKGGEYILNGRKSAWVSNGTIATHAVLHVGLDSSRGMHGQGLAFCPLDLPGISRGKPLDKMGQRPLNQGEIIFEEVKLPKKYIFISTPGALAAGSTGRRFLGIANMETGVIFSGLAQAAFDEALNYAKERIQGGVPIIEHQNIKLKLFNMFIMVEATRAFALRVSQYNRARTSMGSGMHGIVNKILSTKATFNVASKAIQILLKLYNMPIIVEAARAFSRKVSQYRRAKPSMGTGMYGIAAKIQSTETAFKVASEAIQIFGGYGLAREYPVEKMFRDARASMIEDGANESLALAGIEDLR